MSIQGKRLFQGHPKRTWLILSLGLLLLMTAWLASSVIRSAPASVGLPQADTNIGLDEGGVLKGYGLLPLSFEANRGQTDPQVRFLARTGGYTLFLTPTEAVFALEGYTAATIGENEDNRPSNMSVLRMQLLGSNPAPEVSGQDQLPGKANYLIGDDPEKWTIGVPTYAAVHYRDVYPGIDLVYYGDDGKLEYDLVVAPGANPQAIALGFQGADKLEIDDHGDLVLHVPSGEVIQHAPVVYQKINGVKQPVPGQFLLLGDLRVGFQVGTYDPSYPLVIDPGLVYSTFLGGGGDDQGNAIAVDSAGNAYVTGVTTSTDFPTTVGPLRPSTATDQDAFVTKLDTTESGAASLVYSTYLGGSADDGASGIAVDSSGHAYLTGFTSSNDFPTTAVAFETTHGRGQDAFVTKLAADGASLVYSTYLGGDGTDAAEGIALDSSNNAYVAGSTGSTDFPTTAEAFDESFNGVFDAFMTKLSADGSDVLYSTFLGGGYFDFGFGIAVDADGNAYVAGWTLSSGFPCEKVRDANGDAFVVKLALSLGSLGYSTCVGGTNGDQGYAIAVDGAGNAYLIGSTYSNDFPTTDGAFDNTRNGDRDVFVTKLADDGASLVYSTYLGGKDYDDGTGIAVDADGNAYLTGSTESRDFPITEGAYQEERGKKGPGRDAFVTKLDANGQLVYSTYLGGSGYETGHGIAVASRHAYVTGATTSTDFPTTDGAFDTTYNGGGGDAFVTKLALTAESSSGGDGNDKGGPDCSKKPEHPKCQSGG